jgi:signal transduction histidine kinase
MFANMFAGLLFLTVWLFAIPLSAQTGIQTPAQADSLRRVIATTQQDTTCVHAMNDIARYFWRVVSRYDSSLVYAKKAQKTSERIGFRKGIADALNNIGIVYSLQGKYARAMENFIKALRGYEELGDKVNTANSLNNLGNVTMSEGRYTEALEYYFKSLRMYEELGNKAHIASSLHNIGIVYSEQQKYSEALQSFFNVLRMYEELNIKVDIARSLNNIGVVYLKLRKYSEALVHYIKSLRLREELGNKSGIANALHGIGRVYFEEGKYSEALEYEFKALRAREEVGDKAGTSVSLNDIGKVYRLQGRYDSALSYSFRAFRLADSLGARERKKEALEDLSICYDSLGQHKRALEYHRLFVTFKDSLVNAESLEKTAKLREGYEAEKREQQIALLSKDKALQESELTRQQAELARASAEQQAQQKSILLLGNEKHVRELTLQQQEAALTEAHLREDRNNKALKLSTTQSELQRVEIAKGNAELSSRNVVQWSLLGILAVVAVGAVWLGALYRQKNEANKAILQQQALLEDQALAIQYTNLELHRQNEELTALNIEKMELMGIVAHDLKNPLGAIRGFGELIHADWVPISEVKHVAGRIVETSDRMITLVRNLLDANRADQGHLQMTIVALDLTTVVEAAIWQYHAAAKAKQISIGFQTTGEPVYVLADELAIMQVVDNIISNAVKYSPHGRRVFVRLESGEHSICLHVQDEGPGISAEDMTKLFGKFARLSTQPTGGEDSTGLGLSIVKKMVEAMNGKVWCESEPGKGATFVVELPRV